MNKQTSPPFNKPPTHQHHKDETKNYSVRPRPAASLLILDYTHQPTKVLMGLRHSRHVFLPNTYVFPGGRLEACDSRIKHFIHHQDETSKLLKKSVAAKHKHLYNKAFGLAAIRETYEETGYMIGRNMKTSARITSQWQHFIHQNIIPDLSALIYVARAITPPAKTRRYDTHFFAVNAKNIQLKNNCHLHEYTQNNTVDDELTYRQWFTWEQACKLKIASITQCILNDTANLFEGPENLIQPSHIPFYRQKGRTFIRT